MQWSFTRVLLCALGFTWICCRIFIRGARLSK
jgi:hypothetical protein